MALPRKNASDVWNYMTRTMAGTVVCNICCASFLFDNRGTSNLKRHLRKHAAYCETVPPDRNSNDSVTNETLRPGSSFNSSLLTSTPGLIKFEPPNSETLDDLLLGLITRDLQPFSVVKDEGFIDFVKALNPEYNLPSQQTLSQDLLPRKYNAEEDNLKAILQDVTHVSIRTDVWTSQQAECYITVAAHFLLPQPAWDIQSAVLTTQSIPVDYTASSLAAVLKDIFHQWVIEDKISAIVTNNDPMMISVVKEHLKKNHVTCFAHSLDLIVRDALENNSELTKLITKVRSVVSYFTDSDDSLKAMEELLNFQNMMCREQRKLVEDVDSQWISTLKMLQRFEEEHTAITKSVCVLDKMEMMPTDSEMDTIRDAIEVLVPFQLAAEEASSDRHTSLSKVLPTMRQMMEKLSGEPPSQLRDDLQSELKKHFSYLEDNFIVSAATLLDPRFKKLPFCEPSSVKKMEDRLISMMLSELQKLLPSQIKQEEEESEGPPPPKKSLWDTFDKKIEHLKKNASSDCLSEPYAEMTRYHKAEYLVRREDPIQWWMDNNCKWPHLSNLARRYLHVPATSVPAERLFSKEGEIFSARRSQLKPSFVNMVLFLNKKA